LKSLKRVLQEETVLIKVLFDDKKKMGLPSLEALGKRGFLHA